jgi:hypothetical protein
MKAIIETQSFLDSVQACGISNDLKMIMVETIAAEPNVGDLMVGTGGCRKRRFAGRGKGKSGGYRTIHYNGADDVPVLLLVVIDKGERDNLSNAERNELRRALAIYEKEYRAGVDAKVKKIKGRA